MKKLFTKVAIMIAGFTGVAYAQQDPQFTQWMHNKLIYNPGYAGTNGGYCGVLQFRKQWASFEGAPTSINFAGDARVLPSLGVGLTFMNDKIGPMSTNFIRVAGSWLPVNKSNSVLGVGLDVGMLQKSISNTWVVPEPGKVDPSIPGAYDVYSNSDLNKATFDLGFGAYYKFFDAENDFNIGLSSTHLPAQSVGSGSIKYDVSRHYYFITGYSRWINPDNALGANIKYKSDLAAGALDININYKYRLNAANDQVIWLGPTFRLNDAAAILAGYSQRFSGTTTFRGGVSYDFVMSKLKGYTSGSFELFLGVCYVPKVKKITTIENDRYY